MSLMKELLEGGIFFGVGLSVETGGDQYLWRQGFALGMAQDGVDNLNAHFIRKLDRVSVDLAILMACLPSG